MNANLPVIQQRQGTLPYDQGQESRIHPSEGRSRLAQDDSGTNFLMHRTLPFTPVNASATSVGAQNPPQAGIGWLRNAGSNILPNPGPPNPGPYCETGQRSEQDSRNVGNRLRDGEIRHVREGLSPCRISSIVDMNTSAQSLELPPGASQHSFPNDLDSAALGTPRSSDLICPSAQALRTEPILGDAASPSDLARMANKALLVGVVSDAS